MLSILKSGIFFPPHPPPLCLYLVFILFFFFLLSVGSSLFSSVVAASSQHDIKRREAKEEARTEKKNKKKRDNEDTLRTQSTRFDFISPPSFGLLFLFVLLASPFPPPPGPFFILSFPPLFLCLLFCSTLPSPFMVSPTLPPPPHPFPSLFPHHRTAFPLLLRSSLQQRETKTKKTTKTQHACIIHNYSKQKNTKQKKTHTTFLPLMQTKQI